MVQKNKQMNKQEILNRLNEITKSYSFLYILARIVIRDFCGSIDVLFSKNNNEHLNHNEFAFLVGLWIKNVDFNIIYDNKIEMEIFEETYGLMESFIIHFSKILNLTQIHSLIFMSIFRMEA